MHLNPNRFVRSLGTRCVLFLCRFWAKGGRGVNETVRRCQKNNSAGTTLVELLVVIFAVGFALLPILNLYFTQTKNVTDSWVDAQAAYHAETIRARISTMRWDENGPAGTLFTSASPSTPPNSLGIEIGETAGQPSTFDDLDDWNGESGDLDGYRYQVEVVYLTPGTLDVSPSLTTTLKRVQITVTRGPRVLTLPTIYANI